MGGAESKFTEETWNSWLDPFRAVRVLIEAGLDNREHAVNWLKGQLRNGSLRAGGWFVEIIGDDPVQTKTVIGRYKVSTWSNIAAIPWNDDFWVSGNYEPSDEPLARLIREHSNSEFEHFLIGVRFDPEPITAFCERAKQPLPIDSPTASEPTIAAEEFGNWIPASMAMSGGFSALHDANKVSAAILTRLINGTLRGACETAIWYEGVQETKRATLFFVTPVMWKASLIEHVDTLWHSNQTMFFLDGLGSGAVLGTNNDERVELMDVRFDPVPLARMYPGLFDLGALATPAPSTPSPLPIDLATTPTSIDRMILEAVTAKRGKGGPKRKPWWDDLWIEVIKEIRTGTLQGDSYASAAKLEYHLDDLVKPFNDGHGAGDSTLKPMSQKLFKFLKESGG